MRRGGPVTAAGVLAAVSCAALASAGTVTPGTRITDGPGHSTFDRTPRFAFSSSSTGTSFQCVVDTGRWRSCASPFTARGLEPGRHRFRVRAVNGEVVDPTPSERDFRVLRRRVVFGHSVDGRALRAVRLGNPNAVRKALVVGVIHGDESEGREVIADLRRHHRNLSRVELWTVMTVNPDGEAAGTRKNADGVDLNRNFSYRWQGGVPRSSGYYPGPHPFSEPESQAVRRLVRRIEPIVTIWYHQPWGAVLLPCAGAAPTQERYARIARFPTDRCRGAHLPGTATSWENHRVGGTAFVVELRAGELPDGQAARHARAAARVAAGR